MTTPEKSASMYQRKDDSETKELDNLIKAFFLLGTYAKTKDKLAVSSDPSLSDKCRKEIDRYKKQMQGVFKDLHLGDKPYYI